MDRVSWSGVPLRARSANQHERGPPEHHQDLRLLQTALPPLPHHGACRQRLTEVPGERASYEDTKGYYPHHGESAGVYASTGSRPSRFEGLFSIAFSLVAGELPYERWHSQTGRLRTVEYCRHGEQFGFLSFVMGSSAADILSRKHSPVGIFLFFHYSQSLETRRQRFAGDSTHFTNEQKLSIYVTEDVYALGILIMEVLVGPRSVLSYVNTLNLYTNHSYLFEVKVPRYGRSNSSSLEELNRDPGLLPWLSSYS